MEDIVILDGARTPMAEYNGVFSDISAIDLAVQASQEALRRSGTEPGETASAGVTSSMTNFSKAGECSSTCSGPQIAASSCASEDCAATVLTMMLRCREQSSIR